MLLTHVCLIKRNSLISSLLPFIRRKWALVSWSSLSHFFDKWKNLGGLQRANNSHSSLNTDWFRWDLIVCSYRYLKLFCVHQRFYTCWLLKVITASSRSPVFRFIWQRFPAALLWLLLRGRFKALFQRGAGSENSLYSDDSLISCFLAFVVFTNRDVCPDSH